MEVVNLKVLGISTSPRLRSNSDLLLREALSGIEAAGVQVTYLRLRDLNIGPCVECNSCYTTGRCRIEDDYPQILEKILETDRLIFSAPIFFMTVCAQAKMLIDRAQCLWAHKYILKKKLLIPNNDRRAMVIAVGGSKSTKQFYSVRLTMQAYFDTLEMRYVYNLFVNQIDLPGAVEKHPTAMEEAFRLGGQLVSTDIPMPEKPVDVLLT